MLLSACITTPHQPTPGWQCQASALGGHVSGSADVAQDGRMLLALWSWRSPSNDNGVGVVAYSGDGNARTLDAETTAAIHFGAHYGTGPVVLAQAAGQEGWQHPIVVGQDGPQEASLRLDWNALVRLAKMDAPLYALRRDGKGDGGGGVLSHELLKEDILIGSEALADMRTELGAKVADPANQCIAVDDLYPEIIVT
ncbi:hypothetical protein [Croceicoccus naphthovorans]|nr:hypothetical protein [Croceicoccus naphthovorans]